MQMHKGESRKTIAVSEQQVASTWPNIEATCQTVRPIGRSECWINKDGRCLLWHVGAAPRFPCASSSTSTFDIESEALNSTVSEILVKRPFNEPHDFNALLCTPDQSILAMLLSSPSHAIKALLRDANLVTISSGKCCSALPIVASVAAAADLAGG